MAGRTGTHDINTLLATTNVSAVQFGMETIAEVLDRDLAAYNLIMREALGELASVSQDRRRIAGVSTGGVMVEVDEYGRAATQVEIPPVEAMFPLRKFQYPIGWTKEWEKEKTPADFARMTQASQVAHRKRVMTEIKRALLVSGNYTFSDMFVDNLPLYVKRLFNADGTTIPIGPNGETFDGATHTHYLATNTLDVTSGSAVINTVVEHNFGAKVRIYINKAQQLAWQGLAGYQGYLDPRITLGTAINQPGQRLDITRLDNRAIGIFGAAEIWVKPWMVPNYAFAFDMEAPAKPLVMRERTAGSMDLVIGGSIDAHPLRADYMESKFGAGVWTRGNGAVLYTGGSTFVDPVIQ